VNKHAKQPNSFVYRFIPVDRTDLTKGGKVQALQVMSLANPGQPIVFHAGQADADILSQDVNDLHTYGLAFTTNWVTIHDTAVDGFVSFDANAAAKTLLATPFKRPENGQFRPGSRFGQFVFDETGDTDAGTEAGSAYGGFGAILKLTQKRPSDATGTLTLVFNGDVVRTGFDNCAFWDKNHIVFVEDAGDTLHSQRNGLDSAYLVDLDADYGDPSTTLPVRILAEGRDASATLDSGYSAAGNGFQNEGDNEITGFHISDGDASVGGILGAKMPVPFHAGWRVFYTQQHGDNVTWEILDADGNHGH
jgi:secreted PhoX family phosphatase